MIQPTSLREGDTVAIVAPARKIDRDLIDTAIPILESWGLHVQLGKNIFADEHSYFSANDKHRINDLQQMLDDDYIKAIICARGGYGSTRIIDNLDFSKFLKQPKWISGYSDITALHLKLQSINVQSLHSTVPALFAKQGSAPSVISMKQNLFGAKPVIASSASTHNRIGHATGRLVGGNLSLVVDSLGSSSEIITKGKVLVLEDVGEHYYRIDRMMMQLKRAGKLQDLAGLVLGYFTDNKESVIPFGESVYDIVRYHAKDYSYPVAFDFPIGHEEPNIAFIQGAVANLSVDEKGSMLTYINE